MIDEQAARRPEFNEELSTPVTIRDRGTWYLRKPAVRIRPRIENGQLLSLGNQSTFGSGFDDALKTIRSDVDDITEWLSASIRIVVMMLAPNYMLSDDQLSDLLTLDLEDEIDREWLRECLNVGRGIGGKT